MTQKKLSRTQGAGLLATTLLGTSVFILPQSTIEIADNSALLGWILLTIALLPVTFIFGRLAAQYPHAAGPAYFVEKAFGKIAGKTLGISFLLAVPLGAPAAILMTMQFVQMILPLSDAQAWLAQLCMLMIVFLLNIKGIKLSAKLQLGLTLAIVVVVIGLAFQVYLSNSASALSLITTQPEISPLLLAMGLAFWSFLGIEAMAHLASDFKNPEKDLLPAMLIGTVLVGLIYIICTWILLAEPAKGNLAMLEVYGNHFPSVIQLIICILGIAGGLATVNVYTASVARLLASYSEDGLFPQFFSYKNRYSVPSHALVTILFIMSIVLTVTYVTGKELEQLIFWVNGVFVLIYLMSMLAAYKLLNGKYLKTIHISTILCIALVIGLGSLMAYALAIICVVVPLLALQQRRKSKKVTA